MESWKGYNYTVTVSQLIKSLTEEVGKEPCHTYERKNGGVEYDFHWPEKVSRRRVIAFAELRQGAYVVVSTEERPRYMDKIPTECSLCVKLRHPERGYLNLLQSQGLPFICQACRDLPRDPTFNKS